MKNKATPTSKKSGSHNKRMRSADFTSPDINADKTERDDDADKTVRKNKEAKSKLEVNPDTTGIDTKADKTKQEKMWNQKKKK